MEFNNPSFILELKQLLEEYKTAIEKTPQNAFLLVDMGELLLKLGRIDECLECYRRAARLYFDQGLFAETASTCGRIFALRPQDPGGFELVAQIRNRQVFSADSLNEALLPVRLRKVTDGFPVLVLPKSLGDKVLPPISPPRHPSPTLQPQVIDPSTRAAAAEGLPTDQQALVAEPSGLFEADDDTVNEEWQAMIASPPTAAPVAPAPPPIRVPEPVGQAVKDPLEKVLAPAAALTSPLSAVMDNEATKKEHLDDLRRRILKDIRQEQPSPAAIIPRPPPFSSKSPLPIPEPLPLTTPSVAGPSPLAKSPPPVPLAAAKPAPIAKSPPPVPPAAAKPASLATPLPPVPPAAAKPASLATPLPPVPSAATNEDFVEEEKTQPDSQKTLRPLKRSDLK